MKKQITRARARRAAIILLDSAIRQRYQVSQNALTIHFQLIDGSVVFGSAVLLDRDRESVSSLEVRCYFDAVNKLTYAIANLNCLGQNQSQNL